MSSAGCALVHASLVGSVLASIQPWAVDNTISNDGVCFLQTRLEPEKTARIRNEQDHKHLPNIFIGIESSPLPKYTARRQAWRKSACPRAYKAAGFQYAFFVGAPLDASHELQGHAQGRLETPSERKMEKAIEVESAEDQDIEVVPFRDVYGDLSYKLLDLLRVGYERGADYIVKHDDEYCASPEAIMKAIEAHKHGSNSKKELWAGQYLFSGTEYVAQRGADGTTAPYFSGWGSMVSRGLAKLVAQSDLVHNVMFGPYGNDQDDSNLGKWISYAQQQHNVSVDMPVIPLLVRTDMSKL